MVDVWGAEDAAGFADERCAGVVVSLGAPLAAPGAARLGAARLGAPVAAEDEELGAGAALGAWTARDAEGMAGRGALEEAKAAL